MHPQHDGKKFMVPQRDDAPVVGVVAETYTERIEDEIAELAQALVRCTPLMDRDQLCFERFGVQVVGLLKRRAEADVADFAKPLPPPPATPISPEQINKIVAARMGRLADWIGKGQSVLGMGPRAFVWLSFMRPSAIDYRTDQQAAIQIGNDSRASINKIKAEFRRDLGADYPGENGKSDDTKRKCKKARITNLQPEQ